MPHQELNSLYPDILFHFTNKEGLFNILNSNFKVSYAREIIIGPNSKREFAIPMVSFCDLKLTELKTHMRKYGRYGIGLTKSWANENGLNPVMYINRHCELTDNFMNGLNGIYGHLNKLEDNVKLEKLNKSYLNILSTYQYLKNYEGILKRSNKEEEDNYRFADEREWRYVPSLKETGVLPFVAITNIDTPQKKAMHNERIEHLRLNFEPEDIKYLIVERDEEISDIISHLNNVKQRFDPITKQRLTSRILTAEQIYRDI